MGFAVNFFICAIQFYRISMIMTGLEKCLGVFFFGFTQEYWQGGMGQGSGPRPNVGIAGQYFSII